MSWLADVHLALRGLRRAPLFAGIAILSLALGIGANAAIFTLLDQVLLRRLPIASPDQLVMVYQNASSMGSNSGPRMNSYPLYQDLRDKAEPFADVLCRRLVSASISVAGSAVQFTSMKGRPLRGPEAWMVRATRPFPVPVSPVISTGGVSSSAAT